MTNRAIHNSWEIGSDQSCASLGNSGIYKCGYITGENHGTVDTVGVGMSVIVGDSGAWALMAMEVDGQIQELPPDLATIDRPDQPTWIMFAGDGTVTGELPCNALAGTYELAGSAITWEVVKDASFCLEPAGVMEAEEPMTRVIWSPNVDVEVGSSGDTLTLSAEGIVLIFAPISS